MYPECFPFEYSSATINKMSLRRTFQIWTLLSRNHQCNRHFVRFKKRTMAPEVIEKYLDPEINPSLTSKMTLVSQQEGNLIFITKYSGLGFSLHNGIRLAGPTVFFPRNCLKWKVYGASDINEKSLGLFSVLTPKLDLLIIGTGSKKQELHKETVKFLRKQKIMFEVLSTDQAIAAFNFMNNDQRWIGAALIPPESEKKNLLTYVENMYGNILDSTDMIYKEEELTKIESSHNKDAKKIRDSSVDGGAKREELKISEDRKAETGSEMLESQNVKSPLGQGLDFLSSASVERERTKKEEVSTESLNEKNSSDEKKIEEKKGEENKPEGKKSE